MNEEMTVEELRDEINRLKRELEIASRLGKLSTYVKEIPYIETWQNVNHSNPEVEVSGKKYVVPGRLSGNDAYEDIRKACMWIFKHTDVRKPRVRELYPDEVSLLGEMITQVTKIYNRYWIKAREKGEERDGN